MRGLLFLLVPILWGIAWFTLRELMLSRAHRRPPETEARGPIIEVKERRLRRRPGRPRCGRPGIHLLLRIAGSESSCRRCQELDDAESRTEAEAAIAAAEETLRGGTE